MDKIQQLRNAKEYIDRLVTAKHPITGEDLHADILRDNDVLFALLQVSRTLGDAVRDEQARVEAEEVDYAVIIQSLQAQISDLGLQRDQAKAEAVRAKADVVKLREEVGKLRKDLREAKEAKESGKGGDKKEETKERPMPKQKPRPVPTQCSVLCRGIERVVPITKGMVTLEDICNKINEVFSPVGVKVSLNKLTTLLKDRNILVMGKAGSQMRLVPTRLGEYYGVSLQGVIDDVGVNKKVPMYNEHGQNFVLQALSEKKEKKVPFTYLPDLIKIVPVTQDEVSLSEIVSRINDTYRNEPMSQLPFASVTSFLASRGVLVSNPDTAPKAPKYIPADGMRSKGIIFYAADARHAARTVYSMVGQRFVLRELAYWGQSVEE